MSEYVHDELEAAARWLRHQEQQKREARIAERRATREALQFLAQSVRELQGEVCRLRMEGLRLNK